MFLLLHLFLDFFLTFKIILLNTFLISFICRLLGLCGEDETISKNAVMDLFEDINTCESMFITFGEFHLMLSKLNLHVPKPVVKEIFNFCDSTNSGGLSIAVRNITMNYIFYSNSAYNTLLYYNTIIGI
jgi:hypothetical protein